MSCCFSHGEIFLYPHLSLKHKKMKAWKATYLNYEWKTTYLLWKAKIISKCLIFKKKKYMSVSFTWPSSLIYITSPASVGVTWPCNIPDWEQTLHSGIQNTPQQRPSLIFWPHLLLLVFYLQPKLQLNFQALSVRPKISLLQHPHTIFRNHGPPTLRLWKSSYLQILCQRPPFLRAITNLFIRCALSLLNSHSTVFPPHSAFVVTHWGFCLGFWKASKVQITCLEKEASEEDFFIRTR